MVELWISLSNIGFSNYEISNFGRICNAKTGTILKQHEQNGYMKITLYDGNGKHYIKRISTLVMVGFVGPKPNLNMSIDHIDRVTTNDNLANLRYATVQEQNENRRIQAPVKGKPVIQYDLNGNFIKIWDKVVDASLALNINEHNISDACRGIYQTAGGFIWRYYIEIYLDEKWKPLTLSGLNTIYVSSCGRIMTSKGNITYGSDRGGYLCVHLTKNNKGVHLLVHRAVLEAFVGLSNLQVNHKDGDKKNNRLENLEYVTNQENIRHAVKIGNIKTRRVHQFNLNGQFIAEYYSINEAARQNKLHPGNICSVCQGNRNTYSDFIWRYADPL